ncbi:MAG: hypothetical protein VYA84_03145 [Planctomycetota bacterium]|nr:hypothetical protein [Planctomycetota bacterium]
MHQFVRRHIVEAAAYAQKMAPHIAASDLESCRLFSLSPLYSIGSPTGYSGIICTCNYEVVLVSSQLGLVKCFSDFGGGDSTDEAIEADGHPQRQK